MEASALDTLNSGSSTVLLLFLALALLLVAAVAGTAWWLSRRHRCMTELPVNTEGRRRMLVSLAVASCAVEAACGGGESAANAQEVSPPSPRPAADPILTTIRLRNTERLDQPSHFVTPSFGQLFRSGDLPAGTYPRFTLADGRECAATLWGISSWPDGSMKFCGVLLRVPEAIAGSGVLTIQVRSGGSAPPAGSRTTSDLTAADIKVELVGVDGLEGTWTAALNDALRNGQDVVQLGNGPAGALWRIGGEALRDGSTAHGQLYCWHYVAALTDRAGGLQGLRYLGRVAQPWSDVTNPAPRHRDLQATLKAGAVVVRALQGHSTSETPGNVIRIAHAGSFFTAGPDARWDYLQGGGSMAADCTVRVELDVAYGQRTDVIPPVVLAGNQQEPQVDHIPMGRGSMVRYMPQTGGRSDIGVIPLWCVRYLADQSAVNERAVRVNAMVSAAWRISYRKRSTRQIVAVSDVRPSYAGLGKIETTWRTYGAVNAGFVTPSPNTTLWTEDAAHRPMPWLIAYVATGEPQYLDLMVENAATLLNGLAPGIKTMSVTPPIARTYVGQWVGDRDIRIGGTVFKGAGQAFIGGRVGAWGTRDTVCGSVLLPDVPPDGAEVRLYLRDVAESIYGVILAYRDAMPPDFRNSGLFITQGNGDDDRAYESPWQQGYWSHSICWQSAALQSPNAALARRYFLQSYVRASELFDIGCMVSYRMSQYDGSENMITRMQDALFLANRELKFDSATDTISILPMRPSSNDIFDWTPTNGDQFAFSPNQMSGKPNPFPQFSRNTRLHVVNASGRTFQLAAVRGGPPLDIRNDETVTQFMGQFQRLDEKTMFSRDSTYISIMRGLLVYHERLGDPASAVRSVFDRKAAAAGFDPNALSPFNIAPA